MSYGKVRSASLDQDEIPLPPMRSTHTIKESNLKTSTSESTKTDGELARELQAQFDLEVRTSNDVIISTGTHISCFWTELYRRNDCFTSTLVVRAITQYVL